MRRAVALALAALAPLAAGCGSDDASSTRITSDTLTIYTSLPLRGEREADGRAVLRGQKLALKEAGGRVGDLDIGLVALDDTRTQTGRWDPRQVAANAREAAENPATIAYIGDLDSGASAVSVPIVNEIGVLQVSPLSGYTGLTQPADKGEPAKYYPSARRTFARLVPTGGLEALGLARWLRDLGLNRVLVVSDGLQEGLGRGTELERVLRQAGVTVVRTVRVDPREDPPEVSGAVRDVLRGPAVPLVYAGGSTETAEAVLEAIAERAPGKELFATSGVSGPRLAGVLGGRGAFRAVSPLLPVAERPPTARRMADRYRELFGVPAPPSALYGYEAMRSVLDAIRRAGRNGNDRQAVIDAYLGNAVPRSVLGPYAIGEGGDFAEGTIGGFAVRAGRLRLERLVVAPAG